MHRGMSKRLRTSRVSDTALQGLVPVAEAVRVSSVRMNAVKKSPCRCSDLRASDRACRCVPTVPAVVSARTLLTSLPAMRTVQRVQM
jgi:hypothetical protein